MHDRRSIFFETSQDEISDLSDWLMIISSTLSNHETFHQVFRSWASLLCKVHAAAGLTKVNHTNSFTFGYNNWDEKEEQLVGCSTKMQSAQSERLRSM